MAGAETRLLQRGHALAAQAELLAGLAAAWNGDAGLAAIQRRHLDLAAEGGRGHRHRHPAMQVLAVAAEQPVRLHRSAERRVGKECVCTCRSRWSPYH